MKVHYVKVVRNETDNCSETMNRKSRRVHWSTRPNHTSYVNVACIGWHFALIKRDSSFVPSSLETSQNLVPDQFYFSHFATFTLLSLVLSSTNEILYSCMLKAIRGLFLVRKILRSKLLNCKY